MYSLEIEPVLAAYSASNSHKALKQAHGEIDIDETDDMVAENDSATPNKDPFKFDLPTSSTITLGGYDTSDYTGNLTWYNTTDCVGAWNLTGSNLTIGDDQDIRPNATDYEIEFQMGYPYIGLPVASWESLRDTINATLNEAITN